MRWVLHVVLMGEKRIAYNMLVGKADEEQSLGRNMQRWEYDIKVRQQ
jgi:hypothetical protein